MIGAGCLFAVRAARRLSLLRGRTPKDMGDAGGSGRSRCPASRLRTVDGLPGPRDSERQSARSARSARSAAPMVGFDHAGEHRSRSNPTKLAVGSSREPSRPLSSLGCIGINRARDGVPPIRWRVGPCSSQVKLLVHELQFKCDRTQVVDRRMPAPRVVEIRRRSLRSHPTRAERGGH
jgi:hypothetical protein